MFLNTFNISFLDDTVGDLNMQGVYLAVYKRDIHLFIYLFIINFC